MDATNGCEIDKDRKHRLVALIRPLSKEWDEENRKIVKDGRDFSFFYLPQGEGPSVESYVDFRRICTVAPLWIDSKTRLACRRLRTIILDRMTEGGVGNWVIGEGWLHMTVVTSRSDFEKLMVLRMKEAKLLLDQQDWDGAYYRAGYAVEFALKIRLISKLMKSDSFPDKKLAESFYKHELTLLRKLAELDDEMDKDATVRDQWDIVKDWSEQSRYEICKTDKEATEFYDAIEKGVLPWIKAH